MDAAVNSDKWGGADLVIRDEDGIILASAMWAFPPQTEQHAAKALTCQLGLQFALDCCCMDIVLENDNQEIKAISNSRYSVTYFGLIISNCLSLPSSFISVKRYLNRVAHELAQLALTTPNSFETEMEGAANNIYSLVFLDLSGP